MKVKIYGERNTGTNFLARLIKHNFQCELVPGTLAEARPGYRDFLEQELTESISDPAKRMFVRQLRLDEFFRGNLWHMLGWKHSVPPIEIIRSHPDTAETMFVAVTKDPYAWTLSLFRRPYENAALERPKTIREFVNEPWVAGNRDNTLPLLRSPVELWNLKVAGYARLSSVAMVVNVKYEDLLQAPQLFLERLADKLKRKRTSFDIPKESTKRQDASTKDFDFYRDYYVNRRWREELRKEDIEAINAYLSSEIVHMTGYRLIDPYRAATSPAEHSRKGSSSAEALR